MHLPTREHQRLLEDLLHRITLGMRYRLPHQNAILYLRYAFASPPGSTQRAEGLLYAAQNLESAMANPAHPADMRRRLRTVYEHTARHVLGQCNLDVPVAQRCVLNLADTYVGRGKRERAREVLNHLRGHAIDASCVSRYKGLYERLTSD